MDLVRIVFSLLMMMMRLREFVVKLSGFSPYQCDSTEARSEVLLGLFPEFSPFRYCHGAGIRDFLFRSVLLSVAFLALLVFPYRRQHFLSSFLS